MQRLLEKRLGSEALQRKVADTEQHLDAGLPAMQLLGEPGRQRRLAVPLGAVGAHALALNAETRKRSSDELSSTASTRSEETAVMASFPWLYLLEAIWFRNSIHWRVSTPSFGNLRPSNSCGSRGSAGSAAAGFTAGVRAAAAAGAGAATVGAFAAGAAATGLSAVAAAADLG